MKVLVISDSHGDVRAFEQALDLHPDISNVVFLGDGMRDAELIQDERPTLRMYTARGNCDYSSFSPADGLAPFEGVVVYYTHGHMYDVKSTLVLLTNAAKSRGASVALFGHTHLPTLINMGAVILFNPGSVSNALGRGSYGILTIENGVPSFEHHSLHEKK